MPLVVGGVDELKVARLDALRVGKLALDGLGRNDGRNSLRFGAGERPSQLLRGREEEKGRTERGSLAWRARYGACGLSREIR